MYAWLLCQAEPQEAEVIGETLGISRGAVSMGCAELVDWRLVHADRVAGSRRIVYRPETDPARVLRSILQTRKRREWDPILEHLRPWLGDLCREEDRAQFWAKIYAVSVVLLVLLAVLIEPPEASDAGIVPFVEFVAMFRAGMVGLLAAVGLLAFVALQFIQAQDAERRRQRGA